MVLDFSGWKKLSFAMIVHWQASLALAFLVLGWGSLPLFCCMWKNQPSGGVGVFLHALMSRGKSLPAKVVLKAPWPR